MPIVAKDNSGTFTPAPEGLWPAVCVDVVDKGMVESQLYKPRHMVQLRWVLNAEPPLETGDPHMAVRQFGLSLGEKSNLRPFLEAWRGKKFDDNELFGFDLEKLIGACCQIQIIHTRKNGKVYGNVQAVVPYPKGAAKMTVPSTYVRAQDRPDYKAPVLPEETYEAVSEETFSAADEDSPF